MKGRLPRLFGCRPEHHHYRIGATNLLLQRPSLINHISEIRRHFRRLRSDLLFLSCPPPVDRNR